MVFEKLTDKHGWVGTKRHKEVAWVDISWYSRCPNKRYTRTTNTSIHLLLKCYHQTSHNPGCAFAMTPSELTLAGLRVTLVGQPDVQRHLPQTRALPRWIYPSLRKYHLPTSPRVVSESCWPISSGCVSGGVRKEVKALIITSGPKVLHKLSQTQKLPSPSR